MATTKKTTAKKAAAPKKKQAPSAEQLEVIPTKPEPVKPATETEKLISYVIPRDNSLESGDQFFEWNCNGINYRFKRGEVLTHPESLYRAISEKLMARESVSPFIAGFKNTSMKLNG